ncbi:Fur family transcriptional regulator [Helicobacter cappadocius]|uniref:Ferric uptake regulation protein n=1 Tax=Helicobacter cappadocius TaxID=3063998 RepID=A0AA90PVW1_9HELI|nr:MULTISPECIES: Fur family transcriptional regulator [unclassified Helicobacter]MDO7253355.1 Fur family transcriptional regulator [Helicobacter sp. faydin-H75]MDP2539215.1 Fur family transcriptional regulator [Helicobacter sp. faydin-H76]
MQNRLETLDSILDRLRTSIRKNGLKNSKQREEIISVLYKSGTHLSPEEIASEIKTKDKTTSISSVYRILSFLEKENFITALEADKSGRRYEIAAKDHHDHIICLHCGEITEFVDPEIERLQIKVAHEHNANLISHNMKLFVICQKCQKIKP